MFYVWRQSNSDKTHDINQYVAMTVYNYFATHTYSQNFPKRLENIFFQLSKA